MKTAIPGKLPLLLAIVCLASAMPVRAEVVTSGNVTAELVSEQETIRPGDTFTVGIALRPSPGWHTYWQNPGDSGLPTTVDWKLPPGLRAGPLEWPHPVRLGVSPFVAYGYESDVLLLTRIEAPASLRAGSDVELVAATRWLACRDDACIPGKAELALRVRVEESVSRRDSRWSALFDATRAQLPRVIDGCSATVADSGEAIRIDVATPMRTLPSTTGIQVFPMTGKVMQASAEPAVRATDGGFVIEAVKDDRAASLPDTLGLVLVHQDGWDAGGTMPALRVDALRAASPGAETPAGASPAQATVGNESNAAPNEALPVAGTDTTAAAASKADDITFWAAVGLAFLGGLVLNLMPCVFPVLSLKVLGFIHIAHHDPATVRRHGYAFAAGVIVSFWILAGGLLALRAAGGVFGWGFQLQEPIFVAAVAALLLGMALNLLGVFEFGSSISAAIGRFDSHEGYRGSFLSGVLATVLATPCTAPFMGTAIGFALVQPAADSLAVFTSLGAGMAAPYVLLACIPALLRRLPRPGAWMETFRAAMAFPLLATVAWLVWVFGQQTGNDGVLGLLLALLLGSTAAWLGGHFGEGRARGIARTLAAACLAGAVFLAVSAASRVTATDAPAAAGDETGGVNWLVWDPDAIALHRREGHVVFVDFTADWCLSCKVNERVALAGDEFAEALRANSVVAMKADWTRADPRITEALTAFGRSGVPLYVVYPRDPSRQPIVLPQILTPGLVRDALTRAAA